jgi:hypothetical protein
MREIDTDTAYTSVRPVLAALDQAGPTELATVSCKTACEAGASWRRDAFLNGVRGLRHAVLIGPLVEREGMHCLSEPRVQAPARFWH